MTSWRKRGIITLCPECQDGQIRLAHAGGRVPLDQRVYYCPKCRAAFSHEDLVINWPRRNQRPDLEVCEAPLVNDDRMIPIGEVSPVV